jgi:hypothetical protein
LNARSILLLSWYRILLSSLLWECADNT